MSNTVVRTNVLAINSHRNLGMVGNQQSRSSARLSSGFRINSAADDAAGLGISEKMRSQIRGLDQASRNGQDGISLIQTAEGAMSTINEMVGRVRELVVQAANDTNVHDETNLSQSDRVRIQDEIDQLMAEIDSTVERTEFNTRRLLDGSLSTNANTALRGGNTDTGSNVWFQIGANAGQGINLNINAVNVEALSSVFSAGNLESVNNQALLNALSSTGMTAASFQAAFNFANLRSTGIGASRTGGVLNSSGEEINNFLFAIDAALAHATGERSNLGATQNRLEFTIENLDISSENLSASESRIRDADMAQEMMRLTQANVLQQAATSMLAQANQAPQQVLQLLN